MSVTKNVLVNIEDNVATIVFNRPLQRNSLSTATLQTLDKNLSELLENPVVHSIILTGTREVFLSGADIRELASLDPEHANAFSLLGQAITQKVATSQKVTIAAINGYCIGGGLDIALACDIRLASQSAVFAHPGATLGIITGWGGTQRLSRIVGRSRANEMFLTCRRIESGEALRIGLVNGIHDPVLEAAKRLALSSVTKSV